MRITDIRHGDVYFEHNEEQYDTVLNRVHSMIKMKI